MMTISNNIIFISLLPPTTEQTPCCNAPAMQYNQICSKFRKNITACNGQYLMIRLSMDFQCILGESLLGLYSIKQKIIGVLNTLPITANSEPFVMFVMFNFQKKEILHVAAGRQTPNLCLSLQIKLIYQLQYTVNTVFKEA